MEDLFGPVPYKTVMTELRKECVDKRPNAIVFTGDFTDEGNVDGFRECFAYLNDGLFSRMTDAKTGLHLVPGNHDVDYLGTMRYTPATEVSRFDILREIVQSTNSDLNLTIETRHETVTAGDEHDSVRSATCLLVSMNSAISAGMERPLEGHVGKSIGLIKEVLEGVDNDSQRDLVEELNRVLEELDFGRSQNAELARVLDVPSLPDRYFEFLLSSSHTNRDFVIVTAHHNLLPQRVPRLGMYPEMINSGQVRHNLLSLDQVVIYLHGHTHHFGVEVISSGTTDARVVMISAPKLTEGFNIVDVDFADDGTPLGIEIVQVVRSVGNWLREEPLHIRLFDELLLTPDESQLLKTLDGAGNSCYATDLVNLNTFEENPEANSARVAQIIRSLWWKRKITVSNFKQDMSRSIVRSSAYEGGGSNS